MPSRPMGGFASFLLSLDWLIPAGKTKHWETPLHVQMALDEFDAEQARRRAEGEQI